MSIYSGFATRAQEECYDQCIDSLLYILQKRIIKFYKNQDADQEKFVTLILKIHHQLKSMENNKYLEPKTSYSINELVKFMQIHQKYNFHQKNRTYEHEFEHSINHQPLPAVEQKPLSEEHLPKKRQSLWVEKKVDQEMQTMGTIYEKKDSKSPKQSTLSRFTNNRQAISALRTKYGQKISNGRHQKGSQLPPNTFYQLKNRSESHHLPKNETLNYNHEVRNHLKEIQIGHKKKRKSKLNQRLGLQDMNTKEVYSEYEVGDIIKEYVTRIKRKQDKYVHQRQAKDTNSRMNEF